MSINNLFNFAIQRSLSINETNPKAYCLQILIQDKFAETAVRPCISRHIVSNELFYVTKVYLLHLPTIA